MIRRPAGAALAAMALMLAGCGNSSQSTHEKVTFNMSWLPQGSMAGVIAAIDKGYYAEAGLDVNVVRGFGGIRTANELDQGMFEFGYGDPISVVLNRANGGKTKMVGTINTRWPAGLCYVKERHAIAKPADLAGLTVGGGQSSPMQALVPAWLTRNGVDKDKVKLLQLDPALVVTSLIEGKIDAGECWEGNSLPLFHKRAKEAGVTIGWIPYSAFGLDIYGSGILTTDKILADRPETVSKFLAATYRGYAYAAANPDDVVAMMVKRFPMLDPAITRQQMVETAALMKDGAGSFDPARVESSIAFLKQAYPLKGDVAAGDVFATARP
ncbi:NitT/TauT family transport system substrate-binding protein [Sphingomonas laterariae]|uniref:Thiamine pyrimidine synthase n=1 Tax=Edaphosphingomonas laterariae TaxID=861865 RepID=A0A239CX88_9SPHN|nr:ABC transporter substrate-binding protein [Sphingomonas laterariae]SNS24251.1 NitT/TauT family transport system substrate-binding protein [Sphingomonas laterariae]